MATEQIGRVSLVAPCYNEAEVIEAFLTRVRAVAAGLPEYAFEFLFVDDGSTDETAAIIARLSREDERVCGVSLSRNFGHQRAITAGLDFCTGDYVVVIDADLQDPPEAIPAILGKLRGGADLVHTVREDRRSDSISKRWSANLFYRFMRHWVLPELPVNAADYKGFNRRVLRAVQRYPERVRFLRGMLATVGFRQETVPIVRAVRGGGRSKYHWRNVLRLGRDAVVSNTVLPLRFGLYLGGVLCMAAPAYAAVLGILALAFAPPHGFWAQLAFSIILLLFGGVFLLVGILGEYIRCVILEVKERPVYHVREIHNLPSAETLLK